MKGQMEVDDRLTVAQPGCVVHCESCRGRGWKLVSPSRVRAFAEDAVRLTRRQCLDCYGSSLTRAA